jgi:hypothetical protein
VLQDFLANRNVAGVEGESQGVAVDPRFKGEPLFAVSRT